MLKLANTYPIEQLFGRDFVCDCGHTHAAVTKELLFREGAVNQLGAAIERHIGKGIKLFLVYDSEVERYSEEVEAALLECGFRVVRHKLEGSARATIDNATILLQALPEDALALIGMGGGSIADLVKYCATHIDLPCTLIATSPATDAYLAPSAMLKYEGFWELYKANPPVVLACDFKLFEGCKEGCFSAALGTVFCKKISLFDWLFSAKIMGEFHCQTIAELAECEIDCVLRALEASTSRKTDDLLKLSEANMRLSWLMQLAKNTRLSCGGDTHMLHILDMLFCHENRPQKAYGETLFLCALVLNKFYLSYLKNPTKGFVCPPDNNKRLEQITEFLGGKQAKAITKIQPQWSHEELKLYAYKLNEYRQDFIKLLEKNEKTMALANKHFKRSYADCGYWMNGFLDTSDIRLALALAPDIREKFTLLHYMKQTGELDRYL